MELPLVTRRRFNDELTKKQETVRERDRQLSRLGHTVLGVKQEHAKLLSDLRLVRLQIEYPSRVSDKVGFSFQMHGGVFDGFRGDRNFVELLSYMIEGAMRQTPEGRAVLSGLFTG